MNNSWVNIGPIISCSRLQDTTLGLGDGGKQHTLSIPYSGMGSKLSIVTLLAMLV